MGEVQISQPEAQFMSNGKGPSFSQIVCSSQPVQEAFASHSPTWFWWNLILMLHGKPVDVSLSHAETTKRVSDFMPGFTGS
jgi:hypothetical protein